MSGTILCAPVSRITPCTERKMWCFKNLTRLSEPTFAISKVPSVTKRLPVMRDHTNAWLQEKKKQTTSRTVPVNKEMRSNKKHWKKTLGRFWA